MIYFEISNNCFCVLIVYMKITEINSKTNFEAIKLTRPESNKIGELVRAYRNVGNLEAKAKIVDIFAPHIEKEAKTKTEENVNLNMKDYAQNLYLKLLEKIETVSLEFHPVAELTNNLNNYKPKKDDYITIAENKSIEELTPAEVDCLSVDDLPSLKARMHSIVSETSSAGLRPKSIVHDYLDGYTHKELGEKYALTSDRIRNIIESFTRKVRIEKDSSYNENEDYVRLTLEESY